MSERLYTPAELNEFRELVDMVSARGSNNPNRPIGRVRMRAFAAEHGKEKCDAMFAVIQAEDAARAKKSKP